MQFWDAFINVVAIIAIIGVGAFIMIFIGDLLLNIIDNRNGIFFKRNKSKNEQNKNENVKTAENYSEQTIKEPVVVATPPTVPQAALKSFFDEDEPSAQKVDFQKAYEEEMMLKQKMGVNQPQLDDEVDMDDLDDDFFDLISPAKKIVGENAVKEEYKRHIFEMVNEIKDYVFEKKEKEKLTEYEQALLKTTEGKSIDDYSDELAKYSINNFVAAKEDAEESGDAELKDEAVLPQETKQAEPITQTETAKVQTQEEVITKPLKTETVKENAITEEPLKTETVDKELITEILIDNDRELEKLKSHIALLEKELEQEKVKKIENNYLAMTEEAYLERIEILEERLKVAKKAYSVNSKEYKPLEKIKRTLEKDKAKLRKKEAIVAKQKIEIYGVNNYDEVDKEKEQELAKELELLEELRASVKHCEEVMAANKDRYPILEQSNHILEHDMENIKKDLAEAKTGLEKLKNKDKK